MISRRLLAILLVGVVLATGIAAAVHAHADTASHDCAVCRLAHESAPPALAPVSLTVVISSVLVFEAEPIVLHDAELDAVRSPRAPPRSENS